MNFSVYLEPDLLKSLETEAKAAGLRRNHAIRAAVTLWLQQRRLEDPSARWSDSIIHYQGSSVFPTLEELRRG
ncbi:MAG: ribbon-helix-helix protein, CopG family [Holosporales bacterium]|jgi:hypothetical protein